MIRSSNIHYISRNTDTLEILKVMKISLEAICFRMTAIRKWNTAGKSQLRITIVTMHRDVMIETYLKGITMAT